MNEEIFQVISDMQASVDRLIDGLLDIYKDHPEEATKLLKTAAKKKSEYEELKKRAEDQLVQHCY